MGYRASWISVAAKAGDEVLAELGLTDSGEPVQPGSVPMALAHLAHPANGTCAIVFNEFWHPMIDPMLMKVLSLNCIVVGCAEDENTNTSMAFLCRDGARVWTVSHVLAEGGHDHLAIEGVARRALAPLLQVARQARAAHGHDAVFGVPAALAHAVCGFRLGAASDNGPAPVDNGPAPVFTRLDRRFADIDATLGELVRAAAGVLQAAGYVQEDASRPHSFAKTTAHDRVQVHLRHSTTPEISAMYFDVRAEVRNFLVDGLMHQAAPQLHATQTAVLRWPDDAHGDCSDLTTPAEVAAFQALLHSAFAPWLARLHDLVALEAMVNNDPTKHYTPPGPAVPGAAGTTAEPQCHFDGDTGYSRLVLAYLAGNPRFEDMVAQTDQVLSRGKRNPESDLHRICRHLRTHAQPVV